jgi:hypothetical protein
MLINSALLRRKYTDAHYINLPINAVKEIIAICRQDHSKHTERLGVKAMLMTRVSNGKGFESMSG